MILQACIFEIVTTQVDQVPAPDWAFVALGQPVEKRNFRYADMLYPDGRFKDHWRSGNSVPDVSRPETKLWFYFLAASFIDAGIEAIHFGQTELMNHNDRELEHYSQVLALIRSYAARSQVSVPRNGPVGPKNPGFEPLAQRYGPQLSHGDADLHVRPCLAEDAVLLHVLSRCELGQVVMNAGDELAGDLVVDLVPR